jgi:hypothetical protein
MMKLTLKHTRLMVNIAVLTVLTLGLAVSFTSPAYASANFATPVPAPVAALHAQVQVCGNGSAPDYGFSHSRQQAHWTVGWENYVSEQAVIEVDVILDQLNADFIAQTMILIQPHEQVGNRVNCAVHFLRYMQLGQVSGERKDNGFVFLIVVEPDQIDVHYGVGLGLPALTAPELTALNRAAEETYQSTGSFDQALLTLVQGFDAVARNKYAPLLLPTATAETITLPELSSEPPGLLTLCCLLCLGGLFLMFLVWMLPQLARGGIRFNPSGSGFRGMGNPFGGGRRGPSMRGGSGSGRSGRGN